MQSYWSRARPVGDMLFYICLLFGHSDRGEYLGQKPHDPPNEKQCNLLSGPLQKKFADHCSRRNWPRTPVYAL